MEQIKNQISVQPLLFLASWAVHSFLVEASSARGLVKDPPTDTDGYVRYMKTLITLYLTNLPGGRLLDDWG